jgi:hypothetical protein
MKSTIEFTHGTDSCFDFETKTMCRFATWGYFPGSGKCSLIKVALYESSDDPKDSYMLRCKKCMEQFG